DDVDFLRCAGVDGWLFERGRAGLAGTGVAERIPLDGAEEFLAACDVDDEVGAPGCGVIAFGALPFDRDAPAELVVPAEVWGRDDDGTRWHTIISPTHERFSHS